MRVVHWTMLNSSGMHRVAEAMARSELALGIDTLLLDPFDPKQFRWDEALSADIHVSHTHIPERIGAHSFRKSCTKPYKWVFPVHGTPELVFESTIDDARLNGYGSGTSYAHHLIGMQEADAVITHWPRHQALYQLATDKHTIVDCVPMGVDHNFWANGTSAAKYDGSPSFYNCDNQYPFKWGIEIIRCWPWVRTELEQAVLHINNIPGAIQRFVDILAVRTGALRGAYIGTWSYDAANLRNILKSIDYYVSPVRYGDFNRISMEAGAVGAKVISFPGNDYADYWIPFGDQRDTAKALIQIGRGEMEPRHRLPVPTEQDMAQAMATVYERVLDRPQTNFALGGIPDALDWSTRAAVLTGMGVELPYPDPQLVRTAA